VVDPPGDAGSGAAQRPSLQVGAPPVLRAGARSTLEMSGGVVWERLSYPLGPLTDALMVTYPPNSSSSADGRLSRHNGWEFGYLMEGELTLQLGFDTYVLHPGDSLSFESTAPHLYRNEGPAVARGVWVEVERDMVGSFEQDPPINVDGAYRRQGLH